MSHIMIRPICNVMVLVLWSLLLIYFETVACVVVVLVLHYSCITHMSDRKSRRCYGEIALQCCVVLEIFSRLLVRSLQIANSVVYS